VSDWIPYNEFVDLVCARHHSAYSGLITGISNQNHAFRIGYRDGEITLLRYRIKKGPEALRLISQIERVKITDHPNAQLPVNTGDVPDTNTILSQLTTRSLADTELSMDITDISELSDSSIGHNARSIDPVFRRRIEAAAVHYFGPIGAIVCAEHLDRSDTDLQSILLGISQDVGASDTDTKHFLERITAG